MELLTDGKILANYDLRSMLSRVTDVVAFDGPILTLYKNKLGGALYLLDWVDVDENGNYWLIYRVSKERLEAFVNGTMSHLDLFKDDEDFCYIVQIDAEAKWKQLQKVPKSSIPTPLLPSAEIFFQPSDCPDFNHLKAALKGLTSNVSPMKMYRIKAPAFIYPDHTLWEKLRHFADSNAKLHFKRFVKV